MTRLALTICLLLATAASAKIVLVQRGGSAASSAETLTFEDSGVAVEGLRMAIHDASEKCVWAGVTDASGQVTPGDDDPNVDISSGTYTVMAGKAIPGETAYPYAEFTYNGTTSTFDVVSDNEHTLNAGLASSSAIVDPGDGSEVAIASGNYHLTGDISFDGTGFAKSGSTAAVIDGRGYTITWQNRAPIAIDNHSFETAGASAADADGWTLSADADRHDGVYLSRQTSEEDGFSLKITTPCSDQSCTNDTAITLETGVKYQLYASFYETDAIQENNVVVKVSLVGATETHEISTINSAYNRGMDYNIATFTPATDTSYTLTVSVEGAGAVAAGAIYVDDIGIGQVGEYAIDESGSNLRITNAIIVQGQHTKAGGYPAGFDETVKNRTFGRISGLEVDHCVVYQQLHDMHIAKFTGTAFERSVLIHRGRYTSNRDQNYAFALQDADANHCVIDYQPHGGVHAVTNSRSVYANGFIGKSYYTNGFAVLLRNSTTTTIYDNYLNCDSRGLHASQTCTGSDFTNNTGQTESLAINQEYAGIILNGNYAIQLDSTSGMEVDSNYIRSLASDGEATAGRLGPALGASNNVHDNTFEAIASSSGTAAAVSMKGVDSGDLTFTGNTLRSNYAFLGNNVVDVTQAIWTNTTFDRVTTAGIDWYPWIADSYQAPNLSNFTIRNPLYASGTTESDIDTPVVDDNLATEPDSDYRVEETDSTLIFEYTGATRNP